MTDQLLYGLGYQHGFNHIESETDNADYVLGYRHGRADREIHDSIELDATRRKRQVIKWLTIILTTAGIAMAVYLDAQRADAMSQGGTVRMCQDLAALSRDVAQRRDEGFSPAAVMAIFAPSSDLEISTAERDPGVLREETELRETVMRVVSMTYSQPQYDPGEVHDTVYSTCLDRGRAYGLVP